MIDGRSEIVGELRDSAEDVRPYISAKIISWLENDKFLDALPGHLGNMSGPGRLGILLERLKEIAKLVEI